MSDHWPETRDELVARFADRGDHTWRRQLEMFVDAALSRPDPATLHIFHDLKGCGPPNMTPSRLCNVMYDRAIMIDPDCPNGWIDNIGRFWPCAYASHEAMLELMGMNSIEQELEGWVKISQRFAQARFLPNDAQQTTLLARDVNLSKLRDLPHHPGRKKA